MGKLISITADSRKKSEEIALKVQKNLKTKQKKVAIVYIAIGTAPEYTKSPYISSLYDINERYKHCKSIANKLETNDYVLVVGYSAETKIREIKKLTNNKDIIKYTKWLDNIEFNTYSLKPANLTYLISDNPKDTLHELWRVGRKKYCLIQTKSSASKIVSDIAKIKTLPADLPYKTLHDVICLMSTGIKVDYRLVKKHNKNTGLQELISANKLIVKRLKGTNSYIENITIPLGQPVVIYNHKPIYAQHTKGMLNLFDNLLDKYKLSSSDNDQIVSTPKNEIELSNLIAENYGMQDGTNLNYSERMRIIENWTMQPNRVILQGMLKLEVKSSLCLYDILILNKYVKPIISWQPLSPIYGYVDCSAPVSVESIVQDTFDKSMLLSATASNDQELFLLLGHKLQVNIIFDWNDIAILLQESNINGSELLKTLINNIRNYYNEKFPIYSETIKI